MRLIVIAVAVLAAVIPAEAAGAEKRATMAPPELTGHFGGPAP